MSEVITAEQVKEKVTIENAFDEAFFRLCITPAQEMYILPLLTQDLYDDYLLQFSALPANYVALKAYIDPALAYAVAFMGYEKDLERNISNQGVMENNTQYSKSAASVSGQRALAKIKDLEFFYMKRLGDFLIENADDYPLFDVTKISYEPNLRRFFPI